MLEANRILKIYYRDQTYPSLSFPQRLGVKEVEYNVKTRNLTLVQCVYVFGILSPVDCVTVTAIQMQNYSIMLCAIPLYSL